MLRNSHRTPDRKGSLIVPGVRGANDGDEQYCGLSYLTVDVHRETDVEYSRSKTEDDLLLYTSVPPLSILL